MTIFYVVLGTPGIQVNSDFSDWSPEYFSSEKSLDHDSRRRATSLKLGPTPISTRLHWNENTERFYSFTRAPTVYLFDGAQIIQDVSPTSYVAFISALTSGMP